MEANKGYLPIKFGYKQAYGCKVINLNSLTGKLSNLTFDLLTWPLTPEYCGGQHRASSNQVWLQQAYGWKVINCNSLAGKHSHLTSFDLWPTYVTFDPRISWRPIKGIYRSSLVTNRFMVGKLSTLIVLQVNFHIWPTYVTFDHRISWRPIWHLPTNLFTNRHMLGKLSTLKESRR